MDITIRMAEKTAKEIADVFVEIAQNGVQNEAQRDLLANFAVMLRIARPTTKPISPRQHDLLVFINDHIHSRGYAPNFQEMADAMGYKSLATIHEHLGNLEKKGYIRRGWNEARSIEIVNLPVDLAPV